MNLLRKLLFILSFVISIPYLSKKIVVANNNINTTAITIIGKRFVFLYQFLYKKGMSFNSGAHFIYKIEQNVTTENTPVPIC